MVLILITKNQKFFSMGWKFVNTNLFDKWLDAQNPLRGIYYIYFAVALFLINMALKDVLKTSGLHCITYVLCEHL